MIRTRDLPLRRRELSRISVILNISKTAFSASIYLHSAFDYPFHLIHTISQPHLILRGIKWDRGWKLWRSKQQFSNVKAARQKASGRPAFSIKIRLPGKTKQLSGNCQNAPMRLTNATDRAFTEKMNAVHAEAIPDVSESEFVN